MEETTTPTPVQSPEVAPETPETPAVPKPRSRMWLWTTLVIIGAVILLAVATFFALRIVADSAAQDYKQKLAAYETSLAKVFNSSEDSSALASAVSRAHLPVVPSVPVPVVSPSYRQVKKQSATVATTVAALRQSVNDYAALDGFLNNYLNLESQEGTLVSKITFNAAGITSIEAVQTITTQKQTLIKSASVPRVSAGSIANLTTSLSSKAVALNQLLAAVKASDYGDFNAATATLNTVSQNEEATLNTLDSQVGTLQDTINQNVTAFNQLVAKVVQ